MASLPKESGDSLPATFGLRDVVNAMRESQYLLRQMIKDQFMGRVQDALVNSAAWIERIGHCSVDLRSMRLRWRNR